MQIKKRVLCPERPRKVPAQFSWLDQRLVRYRYIERCDVAAWALYLVLVIVADAEGLSYYSDATLSRMLGLEPLGLSAARTQLCQAGLVVYQPPLYQVLGLEDTPSPPPATSRSGQSRSLKDILAQVLEKGGAQ
jgi:hypothetical protein